MGQSYRIRTELGITKTINVELTQEFEFLEILSLKLQQQDVYFRGCADYGVIAGRVTANNGLGIPNARVAIFISIEDIDQSNPLISSIYPYKSPTDRNEDGFRYNLLPYEPSYTGHAATGTLPSRLDVLTGNTVVEIYDKYYKFTAKTNESGDYMIMGVPKGEQTVVMDVDLSDIGEFSLTPQDLIRIGLATETQVAGNRFRSSSDLNSLPQIINLTKVVEISPLWGEPSICQIAINRVDFDLRNEANVDIQPTAVFMGSMFSTADQYALKNNAGPKDDLGNLCQLETGPGQILAIRQNIQVDLSGNPILEEYKIEKNGNVIDGNGAWLIELPMNLEYVVTNEFGEKIISYDPTIGIPTKSKYRFKIKWIQSTNATEQFRRAYYLVPNVREFGWVSLDTDPNQSATFNPQLSSSYYFGLDWSGYTNGFQGAELNTKLDEMINCEDTFYEFQYNRVYTVSSLIDQYKNGARGRFIGIKEIDNNSCAETVNKFPVNEGFRNFDFLFFIYSILLQVLQIIGIPLLIVLHTIALIWNFLIDFKRIITTLGYVIGGVALTIGLLEGLGVINIFSGNVFAQLAKVQAWITTGAIILAATGLFDFLTRSLRARRWNSFSLPIITYPECTACECQGSEASDDIGENQFSLLTPYSNAQNYFDKILNSQLVGSFASDDRYIISSAFSQAVGTNPTEKSNNSIYKCMESEEVQLSNGNRFFAYSTFLPFGERINIFNTRKKYFDGVNRISVSFDYRINGTIQHFDNTLTVISTTKLESGSLLSFVSLLRSEDVNFKTTGTTVATGYPSGISGTPLNVGPSLYNVDYANSQTTNATVTYALNTGSTISNYKFPADIEYFQVITAITISEASRIWPNTTNGLLPSILTSETQITYNERTGSWGDVSYTSFVKISDLYQNFENQFILILQRGVDPYSPIYTNKFGLGKLFGFNNENDFTITANTRLNIPIQKNTNTTTSVQQFNNQNNLFYPSHFFEPGVNFSSFTTSQVGYYGKLDANNPAPDSVVQTFNSQYQGVRSSTSNDAYTFQTNVTFTTSKYTGGEDLSGGAYYYVQAGNRPTNTQINYYSNVLLPDLINNPLPINDKTKVVMRNDRLPSSDGLDGYSWNYNPSLLQQNLNFNLYLINADTETITTLGFSAGADIVPPDIDGQKASLNIFDTFNCANAVALDCYYGDGTSFQVNQNCANKDAVVQGCYVFMKRPILDLTKDINNFGEWGYRYRFFFGLCRGVLAQTFTNNWINGTLFVFPIQIIKKFNRFGQIKELKYPRKLIFFDNNTNNFYYRSSPFYRGNSPTEFIGRPTTFERFPVNNRNLLYPTTIMNLGMKDSFYREIIFDPSTNDYIMNNLNPTSYYDTSNIVNLFVISRISNSSFLGQITNNDSLNKLFNRETIPQLKRVDADLAQMLSINSEIGVIPFTPEYYEPTGVVATDPIYIQGGSINDTTMGIFFSSTTENLQTKDFITPGIINFRYTNNTPPITYQYGIKSQKVPFYQWTLKQNNTSTIFGSQRNNWATGLNDIVTSPYQSLNRRNLTTPNYFVPENTTLDIWQRGYIFNADANGDYQPNSWSSMKSKFLVGAPNHFYFGVFKGQTSLDLFKTKYLPNE